MEAGKTAPSGTATGAKKNAGEVRERRRQVQRACVNCRRSKTGCSHERPCRRCVNLGIGDSCVDAPRKRRREKSSKSEKGEERCSKARKLVEEVASPAIVLDDALQWTTQSQVSMSDLLTHANDADLTGHKISTIDDLLKEHCIPMMSEQYSSEGSDSPLSTGTSISSPGDYDYLYGVWASVGGSDAELGSLDFSSAFEDQPRVDSVQFDCIEKTGGVESASQKGDFNWYSGGVQFMSHEPDPDAVFV